jgi:hypothetical protein
VLSRLEDVVEKQEVHGKEAHDQTEVKRSSHACDFSQRAARLARTGFPEGPNIEIVGWARGLYAWQFG